jgi:histidine ammonia-lyase
MITLGKFELCPKDIKKIASGTEKITVCSHALAHIYEIYELINIQAKGSEAIYGLNTGFGALAEQKISASEQAQLQLNIILSHAVGVGEPLPVITARTLLVLRLNTLIKGYSGASPGLIKILCALINEECAPYVPSKGSVGASGDLAPLAHMGLLLIGVGKAYYKNELMNAAEILDRLHIKKLNLGIRDGLALINGTQAMAACGFLSLFDCDHLANLADINAAVSLDALCGHMAPFDPRIQELKSHPGQARAAAHIRILTQGRAVHKHVTNMLTQDPYSLRCVPQVHGASRDVVSHAWEVIMREINGVSDNPLFFMSEAKKLSILSGGNFHGQSLALVLDYLAMAMAELANISERRIELLMNPRSSHGLPAFLAAHGGLNSGFMMLHVTASALVSENKILCHPASVDSIPTSANREDHVSMGMTAALKLIQVIINTKTVLAIEFLAAHQALDFRPKEYAGLGVSQIHESFRSAVLFRDRDGLYREDLAQTLSWLNRPKTMILFEKLFGSKNNAPLG